MAVLEPRLAILDETDSGLDIDALKIVAHGVNAMRRADCACLLVTHYQRLLNYVVPDVVHVLSDGRIVRSGGKELALELEEKRYGWLEAPAVAGSLYGRLTWGTLWIRTPPNGSCTARLLNTADGFARPPRRSVASICDAGLPHPHSRRNGDSRASPLLRMAGSCWPSRRNRPRCRSTSIHSVWRTPLRSWCWWMDISCLRCPVRPDFRATPTSRAWHPRWRRGESALVSISRVPLRSRAGRSSRSTRPFSTMEPGSICPPAR